MYSDVHSLLDKRVPGQGLQVSSVKRNIQDCPNLYDVILHWMLNSVSYALKLVQ